MMSIGMMIMELVMKMSEIVIMIIKTMIIKR